MEIKSSDDFDLFRRLDEIDGEQQDFHISAHKCDLLYKEQNSLKAELQRRQKDQWLSGDTGREGRIGGTL